MKKYKEPTILFFIQVVLYGLLCINYRAVAHTNYHLAAISDFIIATLNFFVIKKISQSNDNFHQWLGYVSGSIVGSYLGIYISVLLG